MAYSAVYVLGDSLVDSGNALRLAEWYDDLPFTALPEGAPTTEAGYFKGRFSNGYTFADLISNKAVGVVTKPVFPYHYEDPWLGVPIDPFESDPSGISLNFAYGGSHIRRGDELVPHLDGQTDAFRDAVDGDAPTGALVLVTTGGNDIRDLAPTGSDPVPQADAYAELQRCADELIEELGKLIEHDGVDNLVITGIPDVGLIPRYDRDGDGVLNATEQIRADAATDYSIYLDTLIRTEVVPALEALGANVTYVPLMDYVDANGNLVQGALSANLPTIAALHGLTTEELTNNLRQHNELVFFDHVHPNAQANALLGAYMYAMITGTPWVETLPLTSAEVDYSLTASITVKGEVDQLVIAMVAGTTYAFDLLGVSSLGTTGSLGDPALRLLASTGAMVASDDDSGAGFDATITYGAAGTGNYTLQLYAVGSLTGTYTLQAAVVGGAAMQAGNTYLIDSLTTIVLEGAGGVGQDVIKASVNYALRAGCEIEVLRTTNDYGKASINLTGNEFDQTLVGNAGTNILEGKGGADVFIGRGGKDVFVLGADALANPGTSIDSISDYLRGEIVDITQVLSVAAGTNVATGGYLRVTTSGLIQVDLNGGGNEWQTLSSINGNAAVTFRYLSGGTATTVSLSRTVDQQLIKSDANLNSLLAGTIAAAGMAVLEQSIHPIELQDSAALPLSMPTTDSLLGMTAALTENWQASSTWVEPQFEIAHERPISSLRPSASEAASISSFDGAPAHDMAWIPEEMSNPKPGRFVEASDLAAPSVAMPSAAQIELLMEGAPETAGNPGQLSQIVAEVLDGANARLALIDAILDAVLGSNPGLGGIGAEVAWVQHAQVDVALPPMPVELPVMHPDAVSS